MPRLPAISGREFIRALERAGFTVVRQTGSHARLSRAGVNVTVPVHGARDMKKGTLRGIMRDANMTVQELLDLL